MKTPIPQEVWDDVREQIVLRKNSWPDDEWVALSNSQYDLHLLTDTGKAQATLYNCVNGSTNTSDGLKIDVTDYIEVEIEYCSCLLDTSDYRVIFNRTIAYGLCLNCDKPVNPVFNPNA